MDVIWFFASRRIIKAYDDYSVKKSKRSGPEEKLLSTFFFIEYLIVMDLSWASTHLMPCIIPPQLGFSLFHFGKLLFRQKFSSFSGHVTQLGKDFFPNVSIFPTQIFALEWKKKHQIWFY